MRPKPCVWLFACWVSFACSTTSQNDDDSAALCTPGATQSCAGPGACSGFQTCSSTGREFGACECGGAGGSSASGGAAGVGAMSAGGSAGSGTGGTAGTSGGGAAGSSSGGVAGSVAVGGAAGSAGVAGSGGVGGAAGSAGAGGTGPDPLEQLGARCTTNDDCGGLTCITPTGEGWDGASPAKGYCTRECTDDPSVCGAGNPCQQIATNPFNLSYCLLGCTAGAIPLGSNEPFPATHCRGRVELACQPNDNLEGCWPMCVTDADCGSLSCDFSTGLCGTAPTGDPIGAACDPHLNSCAGVCLLLNLGDETGICSGVCTLGTAGIPGTCGSNPVPGSLQDTMCVLPYVTSGIGDAGLCAQTCNCTADCSSTAKCVEVDAQVAQATLRPGVCSVLNAGDTELTSCN